MTNHVGVTGISGFVGGEIAAALAAAGHHVTGMGRTSVAGYDHVSYDLRETIDSKALSEFDTVVHCAYDLHVTDPAEIARINVRASQDLAHAAAGAGVRVILASSMSAYPGTSQIYGRAKLACEAAVLRAGGEAIRIGLVWGGDAGGMVSSLSKLARFPVLPSFGRGVRQFMVHTEDMAAAIARLVSSEAVGVPVGLAHPEPVQFEAILRALAPGEIHFVRVPWQPAYLSMRFLEAVGLGLPLRADSLLGLVKPASEVAGVQLWMSLGVNLRPFEQIG